MKQHKKLTIAGISIVTTAILIYLMNKVIFLLSSIKEKLYSPNSNFYNWRFGKIFYTKKGEGSPLLLIHNLNTHHSEYEFRELVKHLYSNHTVYTIDLLGCGRSEKPKITYTNYLYVQLISDFITNIIKQKTDVFAVGDSGAFTIMACHNNSQLFSKLMLVNPTQLSATCRIPKNKNKLQKWFLDLPLIGTTLYNLDHSKLKLAKLFNSNLYRKDMLTRKYILASYESSHLGGSNNRYLYSSIRSYYTNINIIHALKEINNSIYILGGEHVSKIQDLIDEYIEYNPAIESTIISDSKGYPHIENTIDVANHVQIFFS